MVTLTFLICTTNLIPNLYMVTLTVITSNHLEAHADSQADKPPFLLYKGI